MAPESITTQQFNKETCWKLHGKPTNIGNNTAYGNQQPGRAHMVQSENENNMLNKEDIEKLRHFLSSLETPIGSCSLAHSGKFPKSLALNVSKSCPLNPEIWIIDSGATDHMTNNASQFNTYTPSPGNRKVKVADGTLATLAGYGTIYLTSSLILKNVLHVPKLSVSLLSIHKITTDLQCHVTFFPSYCMFQDQHMGKMIGHAKEHDGLYYLDTRSGCGGGVSLSNFSASLSSNKAKLWLLHCRLGHPSFSVLKVMFPSLFDNLKPEMLHCEVCQLAKHHRVSYPLSNNKTSFPFQLIHTDVWGPSRVPNISGARWFVSFIDDCSRVTWLFLMKNKSDVSTILPVFFKND